MDVKNREPWTARRMLNVGGAVTVTLLAGYGLQQLLDDVVFPALSL